MNDVVQLPPQNLAAERAVLGGILRWNAALLDVAAVLRAEDFYTYGHRLVFAAMVRLFEAGKPIDLVTVAEELRLAGAAKDVLPSYLAGLWVEVATGANAAWHAGLVREVSVRRQLVHAAAQIAADAQAGIGPAEELLAAAESAVFRIADTGCGGQAVTLAAAAEESVGRVEAAATGRPRVGDLSTGFDDLDILTGGLHAGELTLVAARPGVGKSAFGVNLTRNAAVDAGAGAFLVSLEMSRVELADRLLCCQGGIDGCKYRRGYLSETEWVALAESRRTLAACNVHIDDAPGQRMFRIASSARRMKLRHGVGLVVLDYLQLVEPESRKDPRHEQVGGVSRRLKLLARELNVPVVAMAQLNRGVEERQSQRPRLSDLRESGSLEQDADNVLLLHRHEDRPGTLEVNVAKQRNGPVGSVTLTWRAAHMRFENYAADYEHAYS